MTNACVLRHIGLIVENLDEMVRFYVDQLGCNVIKTFGVESAEFGRGIGIPGAAAKGVHLGTVGSSVELELLSFVRPDAPTTARHRAAANAYGYRHIAFYVADLDEQVRRLRAAGVCTFTECAVSVTAPPQVAGVRFIYVQDPEGNIVELNQRPTRINPQAS